MHSCVSLTHPLPCGACICCCLLIGNRLVTRIALTPAAVCALLQFSTESQKQASDALLGMPSWFSPGMAAGMIIITP